MGIMPPDWELLSLVSSVETFTFESLISSEQWQMRRDEMRGRRERDIKVMYQVVGYYVTRECASCGFLRCRRTPPFTRRTNRGAVGGLVAAEAIMAVSNYNNVRVLKCCNIEHKKGKHVFQLCCMI